MILGIDTVFAGFTIKKVLGQGGMGMVYLAHEPRLDRLVALKVLHRPLAIDDRYGARFKRESMVLAKLTHAHIVRLYDMGQAEGVSWMSMDFIEAGRDEIGLPVGQNLSERLQSNVELSIERGLAILLSIAKALDFAHRQKIIHRDIKPSNILLDADGEAYLADFGIAKLLEGSATEGQLIGTPPYIAPEQWLGYEADYRSDLYALGVVAYEWLAGRLPFQESKGVKIHWLAINAEMPEEPLKLRNKAVVDVLKKALSKKPENRFESASETIEALTSAIEPSSMRKVNIDATKKNTRRSTKVNLRMLYASISFISIITLIISYESRSNSDSKNKILNLGSVSKEEKITEHNLMPATSVSTKSSGNMLNRMVSDSNKKFISATFLKSLDPRQPDFQSTSTLSSLKVTPVNAEKISSSDVKAQVIRSNEALNNAEKIFQVAINNADRGYKESINIKKSPSILMATLFDKELGSKALYRGELDAARLADGYGIIATSDGHCGVFGKFGHDPAGGGGYYTITKGPSISFQDNATTMPYFLAAEMNFSYGPEGGSVWVFGDKICAAEVYVKRGSTGGTGWAVCRYSDGMVYSGQVHMKEGSSYGACNPESDYLIIPEGLGAMFTSAFIASGHWKNGVLLRSPELKLFFN